MGPNFILVHHFVVHDFFYQWPIWLLIPKPHDTSHKDDLTLVWKLMILSVQERIRYFFNFKLKEPTIAGFTGIRSRQLVRTCLITTWFNVIKTTLRRQPEIRTCGYESKKESVTLRVISLDFEHCANIARIRVLATRLLILFYSVEVKFHFR